MIIPVFGQIPREELSAWQSELAGQLPSLLFKLEDELSDHEKLTARYAIVANPSKEQLAHFPNLAWVQSLWAGVETLVDQLQTSNIKVSRLIDPGLAQSISEAILHWCVHFQRDFHRYGFNQTKREWQPRTYRERSDLRVGILGLGKLGQRVGKDLAASGFSVSGWSRQPKTLSDIECSYGKEGLSHLLERSDILVCLLPSTPKTQNMIDAKFWSHCQRELCFINAGRGAVVDEDALLSAIENGQVSHAVLDVFQQEPLPQSHPFWGNPHVTVLPHICAPTRLTTAANIIKENLDSVINEQRYPPLVDFSQGY